MDKSTILELIKQERKNQKNKWNKQHDWGFGDCSSTLVNDSVKCMVLNEECGEVNKAVLESKREELKNELVQVAAVAIAWLESL